MSQAATFLPSSFVPRDLMRLKLTSKRKSAARRSPAHRLQLSKTTRLFINAASAGLAAFLAVGITVLGFLIFGRHWWGSFLIVGSIVLLTLLLASNAYIAIGFIFALLLLVALGTLSTARLKIPNNTTHEQAIQIK